MNKLKDLRKAKRISQAEVAKFLGVTSQAYGHYESERRMPDPATLKKLSEFFNVSIDYIVSGDDIVPYVFGNELSNSENELIDKIRQLKGKDKETAYTFIDMLYEYSQNKTKKSK